MYPLPDFAFIETPNALYVLHNSSQCVNKHEWGKDPTKTAFASQYAARAVFLCMAERLYGTRFAVR